MTVRTPNTDWPCQRQGLFVMFTQALYNVYLKVENNGTYHLVWAQTGLKWEFLLLGANYLVCLVNFGVLPQGLKPWILSWPSPWKTSAVIWLLDYPATCRVVVCLRCFWHVNPGNLHWLLARIFTSLYKHKGGSFKSKNIPKKTKKRRKEDWKSSKDDWRPHLHISSPKLKTQDSADCHTSPFSNNNKPFWAQNLEDGEDSDAERLNDILYLFKKMWLILMMRDAKLGLINHSVFHGPCISIT